MCLALGLAVWLALSRDESPQPQRRPPAQQGHADTDRVVEASSDYVGSQTCAVCHSDIAESYRESGMAGSWAVVDPALPPELRNAGSDRGPVHDPHSPYSYRVLVEGESLVQEETLREEGSGHTLRRAAAWFVGSGNHARAMVAEENGYLTQLPLAWFSHEGCWRLNPGYELRNRRFDRPIVAGCVACHAGRARHRPPTRNRYDLPIASGIGCEQCHGPGAKHVTFREGDADSAPTVADGDQTIVNPARLGAERANDVCLRCHLQGDVVVYQPAADAFSFRPGDRLCDHRLDFLIETDEPDAFGVASHGARMMRSPCFLESGRKLTCIHCHDPHRPAGAFPPSFYDGKCMTCHSPESCGRPLQAEETRDASGCVACHMPRRKTREGQHLVFTDHWIRRPPEEPEGEPPVPPPLKPNATVELVPLWPESDPHRSRLGSAYVVLHETMGPQRPALDRGVELLRDALEKDPDDRLARFSLASAEVARYRSPVAVEELDRLLRDDPGWHEARFRLAIAYDQMQQYPAAIAEYKRVVQSVPDWMEPYPLLVRLHLSRRETDAALRLLEQQLSYREDETAWVNLALAKHLNGAPLKECTDAIERALRLNPRLPSAYVARAFLHLQRGKVEPARRDYREALRLDPQNKDAQAGLRALGGDQ